nr:hypothetical protein orf58 [uncultured bacterium]
MASTTVVLAAAKARRIANPPPHSVRSTQDRRRDQRVAMLTAISTRPTTRSTSITMRLISILVSLLLTAIWAMPCASGTITAIPTSAHRV